MDYPVGTILYPRAALTRTKDFTVSGFIGLGKIVWRDMDEHQCEIVDRANPRYGGATRVIQKDEWVRQDELSIRVSVSQVVTDDDGTDRV